MVRKRASSVAHSDLSGALQDAPTDQETENRLSDKIGGKLRGILKKRESKRPSEPADLGRKPIVRLIDDNSADTAEDASDQINGKVVNNYLNSCLDGCDIGSSNGTIHKDNRSKHSAARSDSNSPKSESSDRPDGSAVDTNQAGIVEFNSFGLDARLLRAIEQMKYSKPTLVQQKAIPLALKAYDLILRARTGSGKTAAYLIPILQSILKKRDCSLRENQRSKRSKSEKSIEALIVVPSRELAHQVQKHANKLAAYCGRDISVVDLAQQGSQIIQRSMLNQCPEIVITTPSKIAPHITGDCEKLIDSLGNIVFDEADLLFSYGYGSDIRAICSVVPRCTQTWLVSATANKDSNEIQKLTNRSAKVVDVVAEERQLLTQYSVHCGEAEKFLLIYVLLKLSLIKGKKLIFVNSIDRCYRLKLFLENFGLRGVVLNGELPVNSRMHIVNQINQGLYQIAIATDESDKFEDDDPDEKDDENNHEEPVANEDKGGDKISEKDSDCSEHDKGNRSSHPKARPRKAQTATEYGVSRGIDFTDISCVLNFDLPMTTKGYVHRIGRTARAGKQGVAMSFIVPQAQWGKEKHATIPSARYDEDVWRKIALENDKSQRGPIKEYEFDSEQIASFQYRVQDALRSVTSVLVREARRKELKQEIMASEKLKSYFQEAPKDLAILRHDKDLISTRPRAHLKHVPEYLLPKEGRQQIGTSIGYVPFRSGKHNKHKKNNKNNKNGRNGRNGGIGKNGHAAKKLGKHGSNRRGHQGNRHDKKRRSSGNVLKSM